MQHPYRAFTKENGQAIPFRGMPGASASDIWRSEGNVGGDDEFLRWVKAAAGGNASIGEIFAWALDIPPGDSYLCDGSLRDEDGEARELFEVIGTRFNKGDEPAGMFRLPDMRYDGRDVNWCIRYKKAKIFWARGHHENRSAPAVTSFSPIIIVTDSNGDYLSGTRGRFVAPEDGHYSLSVVRGRGSAAARTFHSIYIRDIDGSYIADALSKMQSIESTNSFSYDVGSASTFLKKGQQMAHSLYFTVAQSQITVASYTLAFSFVGIPMEG